MEIQTRLTIIAKKTNIIKKQKMYIILIVLLYFTLKKLMFKTALIGVWVVYNTEVEPGKLSFLFFYVKIH